MTRRYAVAAVVAAVEGWFFLRYAASGAEFHFWLHALLGGALGLGLLVLLRLLRPVREGWTPAEQAGLSGLAGHLLSAVPDVLFLTAGVLHAAWMDAFVVHISAHFLWPGPLLAAVVLWTLVVGAWTALRLGARRTAAGGLVAAVAFLGLAVVLRSPLPTTLEQVREGGSNGPGLAAYDWVCRVEV